MINIMNGKIIKEIFLKYINYLKIIMINILKLKTKYVKRDFGKILMNIFVMKSN